MLLPKAIVLSRPYLVMRAISGSIALSQPGSVSVPGSSYCQMQCSCLGSRPTPEAMLVPLGHAVARVIQIGVACAVIWGHVDVQGPSCGLGPCLGLWPCHSQGLY